MGAIREEQVVVWRVIIPGIFPAIPPPGVMGPIMIPVSGNICC